MTPRDVVKTECLPEQISWEVFCTPEDNAQRRCQRSEIFQSVDQRPSVKDLTSVRTDPNLVALHGVVSHAPHQLSHSVAVVVQHEHATSIVRLPVRGNRQESESMSVDLECMHRHVYSFLLLPLGKIAGAACKEARHCSNVGAGMHLRSGWTNVHIRFSTLDKEDVTVSQCHSACEWRLRQRLVGSENKSLSLTQA